MLQYEAIEADSFINAISARLRLHEQCFVERDATPLADAFIGPDAVWDFQDFPFLQGQKAIVSFFAEVVQTSSVAIKPIRWRSDGAMGWSLVDYVVTIKDQELPMILRTVFIWSRSSGGWLVESAVGYKAT